MVTTGKPKVIGGSIFRAPLTATPPSNATTALGNDFTALGYVSEDGVTISRSTSTFERKCWGGATVLKGVESVEYTAKFTLIDEGDINVLKTVYGESNVTGTLSTGIETTVKAEETPNFQWVIDMLLDNGTKAKRIYIKSAKVTEVGDIVYKDNEAVGYPITISGIVDANGIFAKEFIKSN